MSNSTFWDDIKTILIPQHKWHYVFHLLVVTVAVSYWCGSMLRMPDASLAEIAMYRPLGDNEYWVPIKAVSQFNFGDPADAIDYGKGLASWPVVFLLPQALGQALLGNLGYIVADAALWWIYFVAVTLFLRRCNMGNFFSLLIGFAISLGIAATVSAKASEALGRLLSTVGLPLSEWAFPNLFSLNIGEKRMPRPVVTEIFLVLLLYFLLGILQERKLPSWKSGFAVGGLLALLMQGDLFNCSAMGLVVAGVMTYILAVNRWRMPWQFVMGAAVGALVCGWFFLIQRFHETPDSMGHFAVAKHPRSELLFLPGYGPLLRVAVVCVLAIVVFAATRKGRNTAKTELPRPAKKGGSAAAQSSSAAVVASAAGSSPQASSSHYTGPVEKSVAIFCVLLVLAAWLAQPAQVFLVGKTAQIYHYLIYTLPVIYAWAFLVLVLTLLKLACPAELRGFGQKIGSNPGVAGVAVLCLIIGVTTLLGVGDQLRTVQNQRTAREETHIPWASYGDAYRPNLRALEKEFQTNPALAQTRTFATFCYEVQFLLAGFHDKRSFLPDSTFTTLRDEEIENRLCEAGKIFGLKVDNFAAFIQQHYILNYWLGGGKYWFTRENHYSTEDDYSPEAQAMLKQMPWDNTWCLLLPRSELIRIAQKYSTILSANSNKQLYPDVIILTTMEKKAGLVPNPELYNQLYENQVFVVYKKTS
jgi:hypothetical protein